MKEFTYEQIKTMCELQDSMNKQVHPEWERQGYNWNRAKNVELVELIDSTDWKWWKHQEIDYENIKVETIDIWHFVLSNIMEYWMNETNHHHEVDMYTTIANDFNCIMRYSESNEDIDLLYYTDLMLSSDLDEWFEDNIIAFYGIMNNIGMDTDDLYKGYITKNVLNKFRQDHGYKDGTYKKQWIYQQQEVEDNVVAFSIAKDLEANEDFLKNLKKALENIYSRM